MSPRPSLNDIIDACVKPYIQNEQRKQPKDQRRDTYLQQINRANFRHDFIR